MGVRLMTMTGLFLLGPAVLGREPIAVLAAEVKELRSQPPGSDRQKALSEVNRALHEARQELCAAIARGDVSELRRELAAGLDPGQPNNVRILSTAVCKHQLPAVRLLVRSTSDASHALNISGGGALWDCVADSKDPALARAVLEAGPPKDWDREIVKEAIRKGALELFKLNQAAAVPRALELGHPGLARNMLAATRDPESALRGSVRDSLLKGNATLAQSLLGLDADGTWLPVTTKNSLLEDAAAFSDAVGVGVLLSAGAEPTRRALERAADKDRLEVVRALVAGGADPWLAMAVSLRKEAEASLYALAQDTLYTPEGTWIEEVGPEQVARDLLEGGLDSAHHRFLTADGGLDLEGRDEQGRTGLIRAAEDGDLQLARLYLEAGADLDGQDRRGRTALAVAARRHDVELMTTLRQAGGSDQLPTDDGKLPTEEFWAGFEARRYADLDAKETRLGFTLPSSFISICRDSAAPPGGGLRVECDGEYDMKVVILARRASGLAMLREVLSPPRRGKREDVAQEERVHDDVSGATRSCSVSGEKGFLELEVTAMGPEALAPELRELALRTWHSVSTPLTSAKLLKLAQNLVYLLVLAILVVLLVVLVALRVRGRAAAARRS